MRKEMIIRVETSAEKGGSCKAIKVAAGIKGVESVTLAGEDKNLLLVIGVGVDANRITKKLRQKVGHAEVVELRTVGDELTGGALVVPHDHAYRYHPSPSPYNNYGAGRGGSYPRDHHYNPSSYNKHQQHGGAGSGYALPLTMAAGGRDRDYYYGGGGGSGGYYPGQYQQYQHQQFYQPPVANTHTVVHHEYGYGNDPNSCSIM